jgi:hypothetical protein
VAVVHGPPRNQIIGALLSGSQEFLGSGDLVGFEELSVLQGVPNGIAKDLYIRQELHSMQLVHARR